MELKNYFAQDANGNIIASPVAYLYLPGTQTIVTGLQDASGQALANPFTGNTKGQLQVAAPDGNYDFRITGAGRDFTMRVRFADGAAVAENAAAAIAARDTAITAKDTTTAARDVAIAARDATTTARDVAILARDVALAAPDMIAPLGKNKANAFAPGVVDGFFINAVGTLAANASYSVTDFVAVQPNTTYTRSFANQMCYYDIAQGVVAGGTSSATFTTPSNVYFVKMTMQTASKSTFQLELGTSSTSYQAYGRYVQPAALPPITGSMVADATITRVKVTFTAPDKNLCNPADAGFQSGYTLSNSTGVSSPFSGYSATGFMPVTALQAYSRSFNTNMAWYDSNKAFLSGNIGSDGATITAPAGAAYARHAIPDAALATFQFEAGAAPTAYAPYNLVVAKFALPATLQNLLNGATGWLSGLSLAVGTVPASALPDGSISISKVSFAQVGKNLFNPADSGFQAGYYINGAVPTANASYSVTGFIPVTALATYTMSGGVGSPSTGIAWFNSSRAYISATPNTAGSTTATAPAGAAFMRATLSAGSVSTFQAEAGATATAYAAYGQTIAASFLPSTLSALLADTATAALSGYALKNFSVTMQQCSFAVASKNLFNPADIGVEDSKFVSSTNGATTANASYTATGFIPVTGNTTYARSYSNQMAWYTSAKAYISGQLPADGAIVTAPSNAAYARLTVAKSVLSTFQFEVGSAATSYAPYGFTIDPGVLPPAAASNAAQVNEDHYAAGQPKGLIYKPERLRGTHMGLAKLDLLKESLSTDPATVGILLVGDSYICSSTRWSRKFAQKMQSKFGDAGPGWVGFGYQVGQPSSFNGSARSDIVTVTSIGAPGTVYNSQSGSPDLAAIVLAASGDGIRARYTGTPNITKLTLHYIAAAGVSVDYDFGGAVTNLPLSGTVGTPQTIVLTPPTGSGWYFTVKFNTGTAVIPGCNMRNGQSGAYIHKLGGSGSATPNWTGVNQVQLGFSWAAIVDPAPAGSVLFDAELGTNDQAGATPVATYSAGMQTIGLLAKSVMPHADILLGTPPANGKFSNPPMPQYAEAVRAICGVQKWTHMNMQEAFGEAYTDYGYTGNTTGRVWFGPDDYHPDDIYGGVAYMGAHVKAAEPY